jgi:hypothetical protein
MEGSVQRVQTVEHESKEEWSGRAVPPTPPIVKVLLKRMERAGHTISTPIVKVLLKRMERAGHNGPLAQIFSIKIQ